MAARAEGAFVARATGVLAGVPVAERVFAAIGEDIGFEPRNRDGNGIGPGDRIADVFGSAREILIGERVVLNFLTHLSGIATSTRAFVDACVGTESKILCTRKTLPGLRALERYAVECGGGVLHRAGL